MNSRRIFLKKLIIASPLLLSKRVFATSGTDTPTTLFIDESGEGRYPSVFGVLRSSASFDIESKIKAFRKKHNYKKELHYRSTDKFKSPFAHDLIDYFFEEPSLSFYGRFIEGNIDAKNKQLDLIEDNIYSVNMEKIIQDAAKGTKSLLLITENRNSPSSLVDEEDNGLNAYFKKNLRIPHNFKLIKSSDNNLYQLTDFFTGCIYGDEKGVGNDTKVELLDYLKKKLQVKKLSEIYNKEGHPKFVIKRASL